jgi:hypothetical protein
VRRKHSENEHKAAGFFSMTTHLHIGHWWSKVPCQVQCDSSGASSIFVELDNPIFLVSVIKKFLKGLGQ